MSRTLKFLVGAIAASLILAGCGGSAPSAAVTPPAVTPPAAIVGVATPASVAVVTAQNAGN
jgi:uncharacterized lipoprotein YajG